MKRIVLLSSLLLLTGCATANKDQLYYDAAKSLSKDQTVTQSACWAAVGEIAKSGDNSVKIGAIALAEKCKAEGVKLVPPKTNWLGL